jgi:Mg/Co/Ni transporter MgtE
MMTKGLALGTLNSDTRGKFLYRELRMAVALSSIISIAGFVRAVAFQTPLPETVAVTLALGVIVLSSVCLGAVLPLGLQRIGVDPAHSSTTIQVVMDILGGEKREYLYFIQFFVCALGDTRISCLGKRCPDFLTSDVYSM